MKTYTLIDKASGEAIDAGLTAEDAAHAVLTEDGRSYEIRRDPGAPDPFLGYYFCVWSRHQVANRPWQRTLYGTWADSEEEAWAEIAHYIAETYDAHAPGAHGPEVMTDAAYARMVAELEESA